MQGQWRGLFSGDNNGEIVVEIDDNGDAFEGSAHLYDAEKNLPGVYVYIRTPNKNSSQKITLHLLALDPRTGGPTPFEDIQQLFPGVEFSKTAETEFHSSSSELKIRWKTDKGYSGEATLPRSRAADPSECHVLPVKSWAEFKQYAVDLEPHRYIFRGQPGQWRLRTAFHRTGRANLDKYLNKDMPIVHRHLSAVTKHNFDVRDPLQNAAFYNLIQHHGFPTPLLDWTYSPFVAAYFAFTEAPIGKNPSKYVRVYVFDKEAWCKAYPQIQNTADRRPHFSIVEALALENARMAPQQALSSFTNVDDIETYVRACENDEGQFLHAIDLARTERANVLRELRLMGITPGSLFPGLDGACAELRERFFPPPA